MAKKDDKIKEFPKKKIKAEVEEPKELTKEEILRVQEQDEKEIQAALGKLGVINSAQPSTKEIEIEDEEEEETITLDFTEEGVKAYQKVGEGLAVRNENGEIQFFEDETLIEKMKRLINQEEKEVPRLQTKYDNLFTELLVIKAVASLIRKLNETSEAMVKEANNKRMGSLSGMFEKEIEDSAFKKKMELRKCIVGNKVHYEDIPVWAEGYIDEYIQDAVSGLVELTERE